MSIDKAELKALCEAVIHTNDQYLEDELNPQKHQAYLDAEDALTEVLVPDEVLELIAEAEALRRDLELAAKKLRSAEICHPRFVETLVGEARGLLRGYLPDGWPEQN